MQKEWFELKDYINQKADRQVWVPLRSSRKYINEGQYGCLGFKEEYFGSTSILIKEEDVEKAKELEWMDIGLFRNHKGNPYEEEYKPAYYFKHNGITGENLVIAHEIGGDYCDNWYISPDLLSTLELVQEGESWFAYNRGHEEVIKLHKNENGCVDEILIRLNYLKDYLCVRKMLLLLSSYKSRAEVVENEINVNWELEKIIDIEKGIRWGGRMWPIHEGGSHRFGEKMAIIHVGRTNINFDEDVPEYPFSANEADTESKSWEQDFEGRKLYRIEGEVWKNDFVFPASKSLIILNNDISEEYSYIIDASGNKEKTNNLIDSGKYLWFKPQVINSILSNKETNLSWYTRDTGGIGFSRWGLIHFGINQIGLITVFAKDIALLPDWQQKIWHTFNTSPDGKVSAELLMSQQEAQPAGTLSPEEHFEIELKKIDHNFMINFGENLLNNEKIDEILKKINRFISIEKDGLYVLAKDIARVTADSFSNSLLKRVLGNKKEYKDLGSLKLLRELLSSKIPKSTAEKIMEPLDASYLLRISDAHIPSREQIDAALKSLKINSDTNDVEKGRILIHECTTCLASINHYLFSSSDHIPK